MGVFDELVKHEKWQDPNPRQAKPVERESSEVQRHGYRSSSVSLERYQVVSALITLAVALLLLAVVGYAIYWLVTAFMA